MKQKKELMDNRKEATGLAPWSVTWKKLGWLNLSFKIIFFICSFASAFFLMKNMGYIIQIP